MRWRVGVVLVGMATIGPSPALAAGALLERVELVGTPASAVRLQLSEPASVVARTLPASGEGPDRIYIDLGGAGIGASTPTLIMGGGTVLRVRSGQFDRSTTRVVLDLAHAVPFAVRREGRSVLIELGPRILAPPPPATGVAASRTEPVAPLAKATPPAPAPVAAPPVHTPPSATTATTASSTPTSSPPGGPPPAVRAPPAPAPTVPTAAPVRPPVLVAQAPPPPARRRADHPASPAVDAEFDEPPPPPPAAAQIAAARDSTPSGPPAASPETAPAPSAAHEPEPLAAAGDTLAGPPAPDRLAKASPPPEATAESSSLMGPPPPPPTAAPAPALTPAFPVVVLDAGHGGRDPGAAGVGGVLEKDVVLEVTRRLAARLTTRLPVTVLMTRTDDSFVAIDRRLAVSPEGAALFLSLHANACNDPSARGLEVFYGGGSVRTVSTRAGSERAARLGRCLDRALRARVGPVRGDARPGDFGVLVRNPAPSALIEIGYLTHPAEAVRTQDAQYQELLVDALADGVAEYLRASAPPL